MVSVAPAPRVMVFWAMELAVRFPPAAKMVVPTPLMLPTVCVPESTWNTALEVDVDIEPAPIWPVEASSSTPLLITWGGEVFEAESRSVPEPLWKSAVAAKHSGNGASKTVRVDRCPARR